VRGFPVPAPIALAAFARYAVATGSGAVACELCPHRCELAPGEAGHCRERFNRDGRMVLANYGKVTHLAVDPLERRGLFHFLPGRSCLSVGSGGCNMTCNYCLNFRVSQEDAPFEILSPAELVARALASGAPAIAFTYNEPVIWIEYVIDAARLARERGLAVVLKTNGYVEAAPLADLLACVDALNVDLKALDSEFYGKVCGARLDPVLDTLELCAGKTHLEVTWLTIPGLNDSESEWQSGADWIASRLGRSTPVHLLAYFPRHQSPAPPTPIDTLLRARAAFRRRLDHVYLGADYVPGARNTHCAGCGSILVLRAREQSDPVGLDPEGRCRTCGGTRVRV